MAEIYASIKSLWVVWLFGILLVIWVWAFWPSNRRRFESYGRIPLDDDGAGPHPLPTAPRETARS